MEKRSYYSVRTGKKSDDAKVDLDVVKRIFHAIYVDFTNKDYFQEAFGKDCVDAGLIPGIVGVDPELYVLKKLRKPNLWSIEDNYENYFEDDLFDVIELLYDLVSKPLEGTFHSWGNCGWHYETFDRDAGRLEFRSDINEILADYQDGWELSENGEVLSKGDEGLNYLFKAGLPEGNPEDINLKIQSSVLKFRRHSSSIEDRKEAVRELADVLEYIRPHVKKEMMSNDERDLYNIANNFGIRHFNQKQKTGYDKPVWLSWIFFNNRYIIYFKIYD